MYRHNNHHKKYLQMIKNNTNIIDTQIKLGATFERILFCPCNPIETRKK